MRVASLLIAALALGCAETPSDPCSDAAAHISSCTGEQPTGEATCDPERAGAISSMDCDEVAVTAEAAKRDGWWDAFLCDLGYTSYCAGGSGSGSGSGTETPATKTLTGHVYKATTTNTPATNVYVRAFKDGASAATKGTWVVQGLFAIQDLPVGNYKLEVAYNPTATTLATKTVDLATTTYVVIHAPVP